MTAVDPLPPLLILLRQRVYPAHNLRLFLSLCGLDFGVNYTLFASGLPVLIKTFESDYEWCMYPIRGDLTQD